MFLHARGVIKRRLAEAEAKVAEGADKAKAVVQAVPAKVDAYLAQLAADEAATIEHVRAHYAAKAEAHRAEVKADEAAAAAERIASRTDASTAGADTAKIESST